MLKLHGNYVKFKVVEMVFGQASYSLSWVISIAPQSFTPGAKQVLWIHFLILICILNTCPHKVTQ